MAKMLVAYYSRTEHTRHMAEAVAEGAREEKGAQVQCKSIAEVPAGDLLDYDAVVVGSPTYYGSMAAEVKKLFDESVQLVDLFSRQPLGSNQLQHQRTGRPIVKLIQQLPRPRSVDLLPRNLGAVDVGQPGLVASHEALLLQPREKGQDQATKLCSNDSPLPQYCPPPSHKKIDVPLPYSPQFKMTCSTIYPSAVMNIIM